MLPSPPNPSLSDPSIPNPPAPPSSPPPSPSRLLDELSTTRISVRSELRALLHYHTAATSAVEHSARRLATRALHLDNRALALARDEDLLRARELRLAQRERELSHGTVNDLEAGGRGAENRFHVEEQKRLSSWEVHLEQREKSVEIYEQRVREREQHIQVKEKRLEERERRWLKGVQDREVTMEKRELIADGRVEEAERRRAEVLLGIEVERKAFWEHAARLRAAVEGELQELMDEHDVLRQQFHGEAEAVRRSLREMKQTVANTGVRIRATGLSRNKTLE